MANNYTGFSVEVPVCQETIEWAKKNEDCDELFGFEMWIEDSSITIGSVDGDVDSAISFIQSLLVEEKNNAGGDPYVLFEWAFTCDKPRADEFSGGKILIFADQTYFPEYNNIWIKRVQDERAKTH